MTDGAMKDRIRMTVAEARQLGESAMRGAGYDGDDARILTDHVLDAALCGYEYSGLPKLLNVVDAADFKLPRRPMAVLRQTPGPKLLLLFSQGLDDKLYFQGDSGFTVGSDGKLTLLEG